ncbi:MAG: hypothetical protein F6K65_37580 [Moorea sp. SIO3C2]|nr:hypothetical protein [Moorena sp. SIO3C2]
MVPMTQILPPFTKVLLSTGSNKHQINQGKPDQHSALSTHSKLRSNVQLSLPPISPSPHLPISLSPYLPISPSAYTKQSTIFECNSVSALSNQRT